jgi:hypothetical protein
MIRKAAPSFLVFNLALVLLGTAAKAEPRAAGKKAADAKMDVVDAAIKSEMDRAMKGLRLDDAGPPYRMALTVTDLSLHLVRGLWGEVLSTEDLDRRALTADVNVGSYDDDSSRFGGGRGLTLPLPVDDDPHALRHAIWLGVDQAYKRALRQMSRKKAWRQTRMAEEDRPPDYSKVGPNTHFEKRPDFARDEAKATAIAESLSGIFKAHPQIQDALVEVGQWQVVQRYRDSEGNWTRTVRRQVQVEVVAKTQAKDGLPLSNFRTFYAESMDELPPLSSMEKDARAMAKALVAQIDAPKIKEYDGPIYFEGEAAAQLFRALLVDHLSGTTAAPPANNFASSGGGLAAKLDRRILPRGWSVIDNPLKKTWKKEKLLGSFDVDQEGAKAERVVLVKNGMLKTLLMSRIPSKKFKRTNGHGRASPGGPVAGRPGNVIVLAPGGKTQNALKRRLLKLASEEGYKHAYIVRRLADPGIQGPLGGEAAGRHLFGNQEVAVPLPVEMVKLDLRGKETPVRSAEIKSLRLRDLRQIRDVSKDKIVVNFMNPALNVGGPNMPAGSGPQTSLPTSLVVPEVILPMVELRPLEMESERPPLLDRPTFASP